MQNSSGLLAVDKRLTTSSFARFLCPSRYVFIRNWQFSKPCDEACCETIRPPELVSVHYAVGKKGLSSAVEAAQDRTEIVVFLSSSNWSEEDYLTMHDAKPEDTVRRYARIAADAGVRSVMCAAADAWVIKQDPEIRHLTVYGTGTRSTGDAGGEHKRIVTPELALRNGVDFLVIGTPIVKTNDPYAALLRYGREIAQAQHHRVGASHKRT